MLINDEMLFYLSTHCSHEISNLILWFARMLILEWKNKNKNVILHTSSNNWLTDSKGDKLISLRPA